MKKMLRLTTKYVLVFIVTLVILAGSLVAVALIPQEQIKSKMEESAEYYLESELNKPLVEFSRGSVIDHFADCILLSIAYHLDGKHPLESTMKASYYGEYTLEANEYFLESIRKNLPPDHEYIRYWHGSIIPVRIMHMFWNIKQIYIFHAILMGLLLLCLLWLLTKNGFRAEGACFCLALIVVGIWYVPMALEYTWMFLVMLIVSIIAVWMVCKGWTKHFGELFLVTGMVTVFLDFLTTETLTILVPLLFILRTSEKKPMQEKRLWLFSIKCCFLWLIGYAGMWASKWLMASIVLGENVMPYVTGHMEERFGGSIGYNTTSQYLIHAVTDNLKRLFPYEYGISGAILVFVCIFVFIVLPILLNRVRLKSHIDGQRILIYVGLGLVPFIRFLVMHNHSVIHCFFAYRAYAASVLALCFIILELVEKNEQRKTS